ATSEYQTAKANYDEHRYAFESARNAGKSSQAQQASVVEEEHRVSDLNLQLEKLNAEKSDLSKQLGQYTGDAASIAKQITELTAERDRLSKQLGVVEPSALKDYVLNAPLLDFMAPTIKIQQLILPNVYDDVNFVRVPKMDRCQTCHLAIDKKGYEK